MKSKKMSQFARDIITTLVIKLLLLLLLWFVCFSVHEKINHDPKTWLLHE